MRGCIVVSQSIRKKLSTLKYSTAFHQSGQGAPWCNFVANIELSLWQVYINKQFLKDWIPDGWKTLLQAEGDPSYLQSLSDFIDERRASTDEVYPPANEVFNAFVKTRPEDVKVVILGQDPYHSAGQAHGLCFSVNRGTPIPPSLRNIFQELCEELDAPLPGHGCLDAWAKQGVLLLNAVLTVEEGHPGSHQGKGWETFTDSVVEALNIAKEPLVFMLWGAQAQKKGAVIDQQKHCVLRAPHPSPLSAYRGFFGCGHFVKANEFLVSRGQNPVDWTLRD
ncbi:uracil-DNA glycosylase [Congregibacter brevis]|uniref:Uracil-DNA glycosylase n=1 Tax=Congregibacter brevis TaxID=3081201 RepID=A0ABZ0I9B7_9GAMM|nr:uracil-DNA glycosylase [Congregibacter sp. IMCC45268]